MTNVDKVEERAEEDLNRAIKNSKSREEFERQLDTRDVSYKAKDGTSEGKKKPYQTNQ
jgi:hypothetical protein